MRFIAFERVNAKPRDGNLWFTEESNKIGKISTGGKITEYLMSAKGPDPANQMPVNPNPFGIVAASDGNLWFSVGRSECCGSHPRKAYSIGKITVAGKITEFAITQPSTSGLAAGPDGNLWFTHSNVVGKFNPATL